jgi:hypothetical protein
MASTKGPVRPAHPALATPEGQVTDSVVRRLARARSIVAARSDAPSERPAPDPGVLLAEVPRADGTRLRVAWRSVEGHPFVTVAVWERGRGDAWWPVKGKQVSVRRGELGAVLEAFILACEKASGWTP